MCMHEFIQQIRLTISLVITLILFCLQQALPQFTVDDLEHGVITEMKTTVQRQNDNG